MESVSAVEVPSPVGPLGVATTPDGVVAVSFDGLAGLDGVEKFLDAAGPPRNPPGVDFAAQAVAEMAEYFAGTRTAFTVPIDWRLSTGFSRDVRVTLLETVGYGETIGYGVLARRVLGDRATAGADGAARAVGRAMATNPVPVLVPCHRVVAADGSLHGFGGGLEAKRRLLAREGAAPMTLDDLLAPGWS
jgi:methylated-DNA-[protein]-cysteine S-methyltransferase